MKNSWIICILAIILLSGCLYTLNEGNLPSNVFFLTDLDGNPTTIFSSGESFVMHFQLVNTTQDSLDYSFTGPVVDLNIYQGNRRIVGAFDGLCWAQVLISAKFAPGDTIKAFWHAPNPMISSTIPVLEPGDYRAIATFPHFEELQTDTITAINFTITK